MNVTTIDNKPLMSLLWKKLSVRVRTNIHIHIDPLGQPKVTAGRDHCFRTCCPYVPTFQIQQNKTTENNVRYWRDYWSG